MVLNLFTFLVLSKKTRIKRILKNYIHKKLKCQMEKYPLCQEIGQYIKKVWRPVQLDYHKAALMLLEYDSRTGCTSGLIYSPMKWHINKLFKDTCYRRQMVFYDNMEANVLAAHFDQNLLCLKTSRYCNITFQFLTEAYTCNINQLHPSIPLVNQNYDLLYLLTKTFQNCQN